MHYVIKTRNDYIWTIKWSHPLLIKASTVHTFFVPNILKMKYRYVFSKKQRQIDSEDGGNILCK